MQVLRCIIIINWCLQEGGGEKIVKSIEYKLSDFRRQDLMIIRYYDIGCTG